MTVKVPILQETAVVDGVTLTDHSYPTAAWRNFLDSTLNPYAAAATVNIEIAAALSEYGAVWLRSENAIEFESQEKAVLWVLRWS